MILVKQGLDMQSQNRTPLVSICCTTYNHEKYIRDAIEGFLMQETNFPFEIIVHDDASTDRTPNIIREYQKKYPEIFVCIYQKENQLSKGVRPLPVYVLPKARGKYIALCEGDDYWTDPFKLQKQVDNMRKYPDCWMSFHPAFEVSSRGKKLGITGKRSSEKIKIFDTADFIKGRGGFSPTASLMFNMKALENLPDFFYKAPIGDYFLQILGSLHGGALYMNETMSAYRYTPNGWSSNMKEKQYLLNHNDLMIKCMDSLNEYLNRKFENEIRDVKSALFISSALIYLKKNKFEEFKKYIELGFNMRKKRTLKHIVAFHLRHFPRFFKLLLQLKRSIFST